MWLSPQAGSVSSNPSNPILIADAADLSVCEIYLDHCQHDRSPLYPMAIRVFRSRREAISMRRVMIANTAQPP
jgi:hypothetical protein